ncbi:MAG: hypothetical protein AAF514_20050, partial [Verrucomicrobiota bacterium]
LKQMHRVGVLGRYLPEFGELTCLVQHEFFHRYTADYHTLLCILKLDELSDSDDPSLGFFQNLFRELEDPYIIYLAFIMHDTGRAENVRFHTDSSTEMTNIVLRRLKVRGERRKMILFLVDHHLTFWRTATTKNIDDPETVAEFAGIMRDKRHLDTLFLFTYADSKGTNEDGWTDWKASLMHQLYRSTLLYWEDQKAFQEQATLPESDRLKEKIEKKLGPDYREEIAAHIDGLPTAYFSFRQTRTIQRHIRLFRRFFVQIQESPEAFLTPAFRWLHREDANCSEFLVCSWNRRKLSTRLSGILAAHQINILSADLFTRKDGLILDLFRVCTTDFEPVKADSTKRSVAKLVRKAFQLESYDLSDLIREARKKIPVDPAQTSGFPQRVLISNLAHGPATQIEIQAIDRLGLLYDFFSAITDLNLQISNSRIVTEKGAAIDTIYVTTSRGEKLDTETTNRLQERLQEVIGIVPADSTAP